MLKAIGAHLFKIPNKCEFFLIVGSLANCVGRLSDCRQRQILRQQDGNDLERFLCVIQGIFHRPIARLQFHGKSPNPTPTFHSRPVRVLKL